MNLTKYTKDLFPSFKRDKVLESVTATRQMLIEASIPSYEEAVELFKSRDFQSKQMKNFVNIFTAHATKTRETELISNILEVLNNSITILDYISTISKKEFSEVETNVTITYKKSTFLRTIQMAEFVSAYSRKFLNYVFILETAEANQHYSVKDALVPAEIDFIESHFVAFADSCRVLLTTKEKYKHSTDSIPEAIISEMNEMVLPETIGIGKMDPLLMKNISVTWNPFYLLGTIIVTFQAARYKAAKEELELLQLRLMYLKNSYNETNDPKLEKQVEYNQERVDALNYKLRKMEEDYNV